MAEAISTRDESRKWIPSLVPMDVLSLFSEADDGVPVDVELGVVADDDELVKMAASGEFGDNPRRPVHSNRNIQLVHCYQKTNSAFNLGVRTIFFFFFL